MDGIDNIDGNIGGAVTQGLQSREQTALQLGRSVRTIARWERMGLPVIRVGTLRLHDTSSIREWLRSRERRHDAPRRGHPGGRR